PPFPRGPKPLSGSLPALAKRADPNDSDPDTYTFDKTTNGANITHSLGQPRPVPPLAQFPRGWAKGWAERTLKKMADDISEQYEHIMLQIKNDEDTIRNAIVVVGGEDIAGRWKKRRGVFDRKVPAPGDGNYRDALIKMIATARRSFQLAIKERNEPLSTLAKIKHFRDFPKPHTTNVYVIFWMKNQIQVRPPSKPLPEGKYSCGNDIIMQIGLPQPFTNAPLPKGWEKFDNTKLIHMAKEISSKFPTVRRKVMDDRNRISQAINALQHNSKAVVRSTQGLPLEIYDLPGNSNSGEDYRKQLINMIEQSWKDLNGRVKERNSAFRSLDGLRVSLDNVGNADPTNIYVAYWKESHGLPANPVSATNPTARESSSGASNAQPTPNRKRPAQPGVAGVSSSKRLTTPSTQPDHVNEGSDSDSALNEMLEEIETALQRDVPSSGSPNPSTPGNVQEHPDAGFQYVDARPAHSSYLPVTPWTASSTTAGASSPVPVDPALITGQYCLEAQEHHDENMLFDFEAYEASLCQGKRKSVRGNE
ncbi:hypothetical protein H0H93_009239, partial [Arthromyces matolae]